MEKEEEASPMIDWGPALEQQVSYVPSHIFPNYVPW